MTLKTIALLEPGLQPGAKGKEERCNRQQPWHGTLTGLRAGRNENERAEDPACNCDGGAHGEGVMRLLEGRNICGKADDIGWGKRDESRCIGGDRRKSGGDEGGKGEKPRAAGKRIYKAGDNSDGEEKSSSGERHQCFGGSQGIELTRP